MDVGFSHGREFVEQVRPILESRDVDALVRFLERHWPAETLRHLLECGHDDAAQAALVGLSVLGTMDECPAVAACLHDDDGTTAGLAEHALWSIWFRAGDPQANHKLTGAIRLIGEDRFEDAIDLLIDILTDRPDFAEPYHQIGLIYFLKGDYHRALFNCRAALMLNPWHFGAMAGLGHCYAAMGQYEDARKVYQQVLQLHPRLEGVRQAIRQIREAADRGASDPSVKSFTKF